MNSWKSRLPAACTPPLTTSKCGTGRRGVVPATRARCCHNSRPARAASARQRARETPTTASAPSRDLVPVPSSSISARSTSAAEAKPRPVRARAISPLTCPAAPSTPWPPYRERSPSRSSTASRAPVDAPGGTPARTRVPSPAVRVTASVGRPRESRISTACSRLIRKVMGFSLRTLRERSRNVPQPRAPARRWHGCGRLRSPRRPARGPPSASPRRTCRVPGPCTPRRSG